MNKLDENGFATENTYIKVWNYDYENHEFTRTTDEYVVKGSGIPAKSTLIEVIKEKEGFTRLFSEDDQAWEYVEDHRKDDVYSTENGYRIEIKELGPLPDNTTKLPRPEGFYKWGGDEWIEDIEAKEDAQKQQNTAFLSSETRKVNIAIATLDDAIEFEMATDEEIAQHKELRKYRLLLSRVPNQSDYPLNPVWPTPPEFFK